MQVTFKAMAQIFLGSPFISGTPLDTKLHGVKMISPKRKNMI